MAQSDLAAERASGIVISCGGRAALGRRAMW